MKIEIETEDFPQVEGCISPEDFVEFWRIARLLTGRELLGLLSFAEMLHSTQHPLHHFTSSCTAWMQVTRDEIARAKEEAAEDAVIH